MVEGEMDLIQTHVRNAKDLQGELLKKFELAIATQAAQQPQQEAQIENSPPKPKSNMMKCMSFRDIPADISRKQKHELLDQKIIEFEDFILKIEEKNQFF